MEFAQKKHKYEYDEYPLRKKNKNVQSKKNQVMETGHKMKMIVSIILIAGLCIMILLGYAKISELKYNINNKNIEIKKIENDIQSLKVEVEGVTRTDLVEARAKQELGMKYPDKSQMVFMHIPMDSKQETNAIKNQQNSNGNWFDMVKKVFNNIISVLD